MTVTLSHRALVESLAGHLESRQRPPLVFTEVALEGSYGSHGRLDVVTLTIGRNYTHFPLCGYEVKATRSDLLHDLAERKWERYCGPLHRLHFAFPAGLASLDEIPAPCGVLLLGGKGWRHARAARDLDSHGTGPRTDTWLRLLLRVQTELWAERKRETRGDRLRRLAKIQEDHKLASELSSRFNKALAELHSARGDLDWRERQAREMEAAAKGAPEVLDALGMILEQGGHRDARAARLRPQRPPRHRGSPEDPPSRREPPTRPAGRWPVIDADRVSAIPEMLELGRVVNGATRPGAVANDDQRQAALADCCQRLGVPMDRHTALAYALGIRHALDRFDHLLSEEDGDYGRELELYARAALLYDRGDRS